MTERERKYRVHELAKEFQTESKVVINILLRNGIEVKNHMSAVTKEARDLVKKTFAHKQATTKETKENVVFLEKKILTEEKTVKKEDVVISQVKNDHKKVKKETEEYLRKTFPQRKQILQERVNNSGTDSVQPFVNQDTKLKQEGNVKDNKMTSSVKDVDSKTKNYQNEKRQDWQRNNYNNKEQRTGQPALEQKSYEQRGQITRPNNNTGYYKKPEAQANTFKKDFKPGGQNKSFVTNKPADNRGQGYNTANRQQGFNKVGENKTQSFNKKIDHAVQSGDQAQAVINQKTGGDAQRHHRPVKKGNYSSDKTEHRYKDGKDALKKMQHQKRDGKDKQKMSRINVMAQQANAGNIVKEPDKPKIIRLMGEITVKDFAQKIGKEVGEVIKRLMLLGVMATINKEIDMDTAVLLGSEFGITVEELPPEADPTEIEDVEDEAGSLIARPPVVTVMGHVDHGKTSLLDAIRKSDVMGQEAGGITQHIGAYQVVCKNKKIVFLDTPGHEAFTAMRARGAQVTDIAILVVAADDGIMPQTIEAINHAKSANVPIIVAINKIDKDGAQIEKIKQELTEYNLVAEDWGGDTIMVPISAKQKIGIDNLLEMILLVAEMQELKANPERKAYGTVIEAELDKGRGTVATILVQKGTLYIGDTIIAGLAYGKVRAMLNDRGEKIKKAGPSTPVEVLGLSDVPQAGDVMMAVDERTARAVAEKRQEKKRGEDLKKNQKVSLDDLFQQIKDGHIKDLNIVIKADVQGSIEALRQALMGLKNDEVRTNIVHYGVGAINESDVMLAAASNALIIGFNVRPDNNARRAAETENIDIRTYRVIYEAINDVEAAMKGMLAPTFSEVLLGKVEVRKVFSTSKGVFAGCYVLEGKVVNNAQTRLVRDGIVLQEDKISSLRRFKDDVKEVSSGYECGITLEKLRDIKESDIFEVFIMEEVKAD